MKFSGKDEYWMLQAYQLAEKAAALGEIPVGAVLVCGDCCIGQGHNQPILQNDATAHAEIVAIRDACSGLGNYRLPENTTLYVTLEPCTMCVGALVHARVDRVVFATTEPKAGSLLSARRLLDDGYYNHRFQVDYGCMQEQCSAQLSQFFKRRRNEIRQKKNLD